MEQYLVKLNFLLTIGLSIWATIFKKKSDHEIEKLKLELSRQNDRKSKLSESQRAILFIIQNMTANTITVRDNLDIEGKITMIMKNKAYNKIFSLELFTNSIVALFNEISLSTCSERVMAVRLRLQETTYENKKNEYYVMVLYSVFYKYLYFDFTGNEIDDLYLLKYNLINFNEDVTVFEKLKDEIYSDLIRKNNWDNLKN